MDAQFFLKLVLILGTLFLCYWYSKKEHGDE